jgi:hypothetical protein
MDEHHRNRLGGRAGVVMDVNLRDNRKRKLKIVGLDNSFEDIRWKGEQRNTPARRKIVLMGKIK